MIWTKERPNPETHRLAPDTPLPDTPLPDTPLPDAPLPEAPSPTRPAPAARKLATAVGDWLDERSGWRGFVRKNLEEPLPAGVSWWQTLGSLLLTLLGFQFVTGLMLAMYYSPSPDHAHQSVSFLMDRVAFGAAIRGLHHWGSTFIVLVMAAHVLRVFFWGAYKKPRELTWVVGVLIFQVILGFSFTGYLLPWDQKAYWATVVGTRIAATVPFIGEYVMRLIRGGTEVGAFTLTRFYAVHIMVLPAALMALTGAHLYLVRRHHIAGPVTPQKGGPVPFFPVQVFKDGIVALAVVGALAFAAVHFRPELTGVADPSRTDFTPRPEWYFLGLYELLKLIPSKFEVVGTIVIPGLVVTAMLLLPWLDRSPSRHPAKRRWVIDVGLLLIIAVTLMTVKGILEEPPHAAGKPVKVTTKAPETRSLPESR